MPGAQLSGGRPRLLYTVLPRPRVSLHRGLVPQELQGAQSPELSETKRLADHAMSRGAVNQEELVTADFCRTLSGPRRLIGGGAALSPARESLGSARQRQVLRGRQVPAPSPSGTPLWRVASRSTCSTLQNRKLAPVAPLFRMRAPGAPNSAHEPRNGPREGCRAAPERPSERPSERHLARTDRRVERPRRIRLRRSLRKTPSRRR